MWWWKEVSTTYTYSAILTGSQKFKMCQFCWSFPTTNFWIYLFSLFFFLVSILLVLALICIISFLLLAWGFICFSFFSVLRWKTYPIASPGANDIGKGEWNSHIWLKLVINLGTKISNKKGRMAIKKGTTRSAQCPNSVKAHFIPGTFSLLCLMLPFSQLALGVCWD